jgi:hypothetical protein
MIKQLTGENRMQEPNSADEEECLTHDHDGYIVARFKLAEGGFKEIRLHEMVCETFHGPKPSENSITIILDKGLYPTARNVGWLTQAAEYTYRG